MQIPNFMQFRNSQACQSLNLQRHKTNAQFTPIWRVFVQACRAGGGRGGELKLIAIHLVKIDRGSARLCRVFDGPLLSHLTRF